MQQKIRLHYYAVKRHARNIILILALAKTTCLKEVKIQNTIMKNLEI